jgi:NAD+ kinase
VLALTPISAFRPRRWRGALLPHTARVTVEVLEADDAPVATPLPTTSRFVTWLRFTFPKIAT